MSNPPLPPPTPLLPNGTSASDQEWDASHRLGETVTVEEGAAAAIGASVLPMGIPVEIEMIVQVRPG